MTDQKKMGGKVQISDEAIAVIASIAAQEIKGIVEMSSTIAGELVEKLGRKSSGKGVRIRRLDDGLILDLFVIMDYGIEIPQIALEGQRSVKSAVERLSGLSVVEVNMNVQGIRYPKEVG